MSAAQTEAMGAEVLSHGKDQTQKAWMNKMGAVVGAKLQDLVLKESYAGFDGRGVDYTDQKVYQDFTEDFRDRIYVVESQDFEASLRGRELRLTALAGDCADCSIEIIPDYGSELDSRRIITVHMSLSRGQAAVVASLPKSARQARVFISGGNLQGEAVVTAHSRKSR